MTIDEGRTVNLAIQVLPFVEDVFPVVDKAIQVIAESGVRYEVGPMETVLEGPLDRLLEVAKAAHRACFAAGADRVITFIKIGDQKGGTTIDEKMARYRNP